jgi:hypothetical protein
MRRGTLSYERLRVSGLPSLILRTVDGAITGRAVILHPLWRITDDVTRRLLGSDWRPDIQYVDTFNLERRQPDQSCTPVVLAKIPYRLRLRFDTTPETPGVMNEATRG